MCALSKTWLVSALLAIVLCLFAAQANAFNVALFDNKHFKGRSTSIDVKGCTDIPSEWDDIISSIEPSQCILIFKHPKCTGPRVRLEPYSYGTAYLEEINFEDKLSSVAPCSFGNTNTGRPQRDEN